MSYPTKLHLVHFRDWAPSPLDPKGLGPEEIQDFWVVPLIQTRDSEDAATKRFAAALKDLGGEGDREDEDGNPVVADVQVHRFNHWACGWFEIILVRPRSPAMKPLHKLMRKLSREHAAAEADMVFDENAERDMLAYIKRQVSDHVTLTPSVEEAYHAMCRAFDQAERVLVEHWRYSTAERKEVLQAAITAEADWVTLCLRTQLRRLAGVTE